MHFAAQLVRLREQRNWTQQALSDALGLNLTQVKRYETGASQPSLEALNRNATTEFSNLLKRTLAKEKKERPQSMTDFLREMMSIRVLKVLPKAAVEKAGE